MKHRLSCIAALIASTLLQVQAFAPFQAGDRVAFVGDSITHGGSYHVFIQTFYATRFPDREIEMFNCGISGDQARGAFERASLDGKGFWGSDIRRCKANVATIMLGMNDVGSHFLDHDSREALDAQTAKHLEWYAYNYNVLLDNLEKLGTERIAIIQSSPYDQTMVNPKARANLLKFGFGKNDAIVQLGKEVLDEQSKQRGYPIIDFNTPMLEINKREQKRDPGFSIVGLDRVHPGSNGHMAMAYTFLKAQGLAGPVAETTVDAKQKPSMQFEYAPAALPFPRRPAGNVDPLIPFDREFNQERLIIKNLPRGTYRLTIDGLPLGAFHNKALARGINLAVLNTPQAAQAQTVLELCQKRAAENCKLRDVVWAEGYLRKMKNFDATDVAAAKALFQNILDGNEPEGLPWEPTPYAKGLFRSYVNYADQFDAIFESLTGLTDKIYAAAQPQSHTLEVKRVE